jgi:hypothetical protein
MPLIYEQIALRGLSTELLFITRLKENGNQKMQQLKHSTWLGAQQ